VTYAKIIITLSQRGVLGKVDSGSGETSSGLVNYYRCSFCRVVGYINRGSALTRASVGHSSVTVDKSELCVNTVPSSGHNHGRIKAFSGPGPKTFCGAPLHIQHTVQ